jgi:SsrA-binding protein
MVITKNKKAYFEYKIIDEYVTGIVLVGSEMKPIKNREVSINEAYCFIQDKEVFIKGMHIAEYQLVGKYDTHEPTRTRKLLLKKKEIIQIQKKIAQKGMTLIPLNIHTTSTGLIKVKIGLAKGKKLHDKKDTIKNRDIKRETDRELKNY